MKNGYAFICAAFAATVLVESIFAQGSLTPPGAPGTTMKTLDQVEARTLIDTPHTAITQPGSYYLAANLVATGNSRVIAITADNVSLDLNGFSIIGGAFNCNGISIQGPRDNVQVFNGTIRDCKHLGIYAGDATRCAFRDLVIVGNGVNSTAYAGLRAGSGAVVENCRIEDNDHIGLWVLNDAKVVGNTISDNATKGLYITGTGNYVADNIVKGNADNYDIATGNQLNLLLCEIPETIDWPCSVKLSGTLTCAQTVVNGITVAANDVTIDMDGHTLIGPGASSRSGIWQESSYRNLRVSNGKFVHWEGEFNSGVSMSGAGGIVSDIQASTNYNGITIGKGSMISKSTAYSNINYGIFVSSGSAVDKCTLYYNGGDGIRANGKSRINNCVCYDNSTGIHLVGMKNQVDGNTVTGNTRGIEVVGDYVTGNIIVRNFASGNTTNYYIAVGNATGTISTTPVGAGAWDNFSF